MDNAIQPGTIIAGKYRVESVVGSGGMGVVLRATQIGLDRAVAVKMLLSEHRGNADAVERFYREAKAAARVRGEHIAHVIDVGKNDDGDPYIAMEFLDGEDLRAVLRREQRFPLERAVSYMLEACSALAEAHAAQIIHRDLKPANLFIAKTQSGDSVLKVLDFGISKITDDVNRLTNTSSSLGTVYYMAPEQIETPRAVDQRVDIWSLGCLFFEFLTGEPPFLGDALPQIVAMVLKGDRKHARDFVPDLPPEVDVVIDRCLEPSPAGRYANAGELAEALAALTKDPAHERLAEKVVRSSARTSLVPSQPKPETTKLPLSLPLPISVGAPGAGGAPKPDSVLSLTAVGGKEIETGDPIFTGEIEVVKNPSAPPEPPPAPPPKPAPLALMGKNESPSAEQVSGDRGGDERPIASASPPLPKDGAPPAEGRRVVRIIEFEEGKEAPKLELDVQKKAQQKAEKARASALVRIGIPAFLIALGSILGIVFLGPQIAVSRVRAAATAAGITLTNDSPTITTHGWEFSNVNATFASLPGTTFHAGRASESWMGGELTVIDVEVSSSNSAAEVDRALNAAQPLLTSSVDLINVRWKYTPRADLTFDGAAASVAVKPNPGRTSQFLSPRTYVRTTRGVLGPFGVNVEFAPDTSRIRVALDPAVPDGASIIVVSHASVLHVNAQAPRGPLARYGIPATFLGLSEGQAPDLELAIDAQIDEKGIVEGTGKASVFDMKIGNSQVNAITKFSIDGNTKFIKLKTSDAKVGPFPAFVHGEWAATEPLHIPLYFQSTNVACADLFRARVKKELGVAGVLVTDLARYTGAMKGVGSVSVSGSLVMDLDLPPKIAATTTVTDTCGLAIFPSD